MADALDRLCTKVRAAIRDEDMGQAEYAEMYKDCIAAIHGGPRPNTEVCKFLLDNLRDEIMHGERLKIFKQMECP